MADVAERQLMKVTGFSDGTDTYKGIRNFSFRRNAQPNAPVMLEGDLTPSRLEPIESNTPPFSGQVVFSGPNAASLQGNTIASATITVRDVTDASSTETGTITNMHIKGFSGRVDNLKPGEVAYDYDATNVVFA